MSWFRTQRALRLAVIVLLALNVVPEAFAAFPVCKYDFGPGVAAAPQTGFRHSHGMSFAHECVATMPDRQTVAHHANEQAPGSAVAVVPVVAHPASMLAARGPSPRGPPPAGWLIQRSSVLLLI